MIYFKPQISEEAVLIRAYHRLFYIIQQFFRFSKYINSISVHSTEWENEKKTNIDRNNHTDNKLSVELHCLINETQTIKFNNNSYVRSNLRHRGLS